MEQLIVNGQLVVRSRARYVVSVVEELLAHVISDVGEEVDGEGSGLYVDEAHTNGGAPLVVERPRPPRTRLLTSRSRVTHEKNAFSC